MNQIEQTLDSREVAKMVGKQHKNLLADVRGYVEELGELKIQPTDFFRENTYKTAQNKTMPCYGITKKGCEFIAHKLTGIKGTEFTAKYINRFHDMEDVIMRGIPEKKQNTTKKPRLESLSAANSTVKTLTPILEAAGCNSQIVLLTAKAVYEKAGLALPIEVKADQQYFDTVHIARKVGIYYQSSGKPADKAINEIIRRLDVPKTMYTETWESKGHWQGTVRKYAPQVIEMVRQWYIDNGYPRDIEYQQCDGQTKAYHVIWRKDEVA